MRTKSKMLGFSLNDAELEKLRRDAEKAGMNRSAYIRKKLEEVKPIPFPPLDLAEDLAALHEINCEMEKIAQRTRIEDGIDKEAYRECVAKLNVILEDVISQIRREDKPASDRFVK